MIEVLSTALRAKMYKAAAEGASMNHQRHRALLHVKLFETEAPCI